MAQLVEILGSFDSTLNDALLVLCRAYAVWGRRCGFGLRAWYEEGLTSSGYRVMEVEAGRCTEHEVAECDLDREFCFVLYCGWCWRMKRSCRRSSEGGKRKTKMILMRLGGRTDGWLREAGGVAPALLRQHGGANDQPPFLH